LIPEFDDMLGNFLKQGSVDGYPITIQDGEEAYSFLIYAQPIEYKDEAAALVSFVDFTRQKKAEQELARLYDATSYLFLANSMRELAERIVNGIVKEFNQVDCGLILLDENRGQLVRIARAGEYGIELDEAISIDGAGLVPLVFREQQHLYAPDVREDESYVPNVPTTRSEFVIPLKSHRGIIGVLDFQSQVVDGFSESDRRLLLVFSERAAAALENMKLYEAVQQQAETLEQRVEERTQELSEAVEKQRELLRVKTRFVSMVSHEYRTPLTIISSSASILQRYGDRLEAEKKEHHLGKIQSQVHKLADMVHTVVQLNRAETIGMDFAPQEVDAAELLAQVLQQFQKKQNAIPLHLEIEGEPRPVWLDEYLFRLLTEHLIDNAVKYSRDAYPVICRLEYHDDKLLFQVKDRGIGIPAEDSDKIFTNFHRAQNVGQIPGTGLGLPLVRQAVETHNGNLYFETEEGQGTTFTVTLSIDPH
jgi:signal transduction histidine kinase